jgi:protein tyrosine phosphatase (PTP) superfamily phosphohydrolase (DUF442 family)
MSLDDAYNFRRIHERLTTSGFVTAAHLEHLHDEGYAAVINLLPDGHDLALVDEARILAEQGVDYVYLPVDFDAPTAADLDAFTDALDARLDQKVHVHCAANYRVTAFYSLYARRRGLWTAAEADRLVGEIWNPAEHPAWAAFLAEHAP